MVAAKLESAIWLGGGALGCLALAFFLGDPDLMPLLWFIVAAIGVTALGYAVSAALLAARKLDAIHAAAVGQTESVTGP